MRRFSYNMALASIFVFLAPAFTGCMTTMVKEQRPRKGPVEEVGYIDRGGGEIKYSPEGWGWAVGMRRRSALRRMRKVCRELEAKITDEFTWEDVEIPYTSGKVEDSVGEGIRHYQFDPYIHIVFECVEEKK